MIFVGIMLPSRSFYFLPVPFTREEVSRMVLKDMITIEIAS